MSISTINDPSRLADIIVAHLTMKVSEKQKILEAITVEELQQSNLYGRSTLSMVEHIRDPKKSGIIAEFKRMSPSKGIINDLVTVESVTQGYSEAGASGLSILTDLDFFGGTSDDLMKARKVN